jgi:hypothetical protein
MQTVAKLAPPSADKALRAKVLVTGHVLHARIAAQDHPPVGPDFHFRVHQVEDFLRQVDDSMVDSPEELRLYYQHLGDSPDISSL